nr:hypothetical protein [Desulfosporosinus metallidurans]
MRNHVKEIESVLQNHGYSINNIICEVMKTFKLKTLCRQVGFQKEAGYSTSELLTLMLILSLYIDEQFQRRVPFLSADCRLQRQLCRLHGSGFRRLG